MLASFLVYLRPTENCPMDQHVGRWLHGLLFYLIQQDNPALATALHESERKPFTISPLLGRFVRKGRRKLATPDQLYRVRYTVLNEEIFSALKRMWVTRLFSQETLLIKDYPFSLVRLGYAPYERDPWVATTSYAKIANQKGPQPIINLKFLSPTAFKDEQRSFLFPLPRNVFGSYLRTWQSFSNIPLSDDLLDWIDSTIAISRYDLKTQFIQAGRYKLIGFTGQCSYRATDSDPTRLAELNALADFAFFAGTGMKNTQGMGQTRRFKKK